MGLLKFLKKKDESKGKGVPETFEGFMVEVKKRSAQKVEDIEDLDDVGGIDLIDR
jgi:hypothetical protein